MIILIIIIIIIIIVSFARRVHPPPEVDMRPTAMPLPLLRDLSFVH
jgi:hypothetical protein